MVEGRKVEYGKNLPGKSYEKSTERRPYCDSDEDETETKGEDPGPAKATFIGTTRTLPNRTYRVLSEVVSAR